MCLEKITGRYFPYCQFCIHENHCELQHYKFLGIQLSDPVKSCIGRILYYSKRKILVCEDCRVIIEKPFEKGICKKFNPAPVFPASELPSINPKYQAVLMET